jgi:hypothetical protein
VILGAGLGLFGAVFVHYRAEYRLIADHIPRCGYLCDQYWIGNLFFRFSEVSRLAAAGRVIHAALVVTFSLGVAALARLVSKEGFQPDRDDRDVALFVAGALLLLASYVLESSTYYRAIHFLLTLPLLTKVGFGERGPRTARTLAALLWVVVMFLLWIGVLFRAAEAISRRAPALDWARRALFTARDVGWLCAMLGFGAFTAVILLGLLRPAPSRRRAE